MPKPQYAILLDGAFVINKLRNKLRRFPTADDVLNECKRIQQHELLKDYDLLRVYFYHARPLTQELTNPLSKEIRKLGNDGHYRAQTQLIDRLETMPDVAVRLGELYLSGWRIGDRAKESLLREQRAMEAQDLVPDIKQKGVDLRIGLDIARLSLRSMVRAIVLVTGDSDFVPALKAARREGVRVYLDYMGHGVRQELKVHVDRVL